MLRYATRAIVLRTIDYGESDRIVTLLTESHGKLAALARAARKSQRRFGAALGLFGVGEAQVIERPSHELATLERFDAEPGYPGLLTDVAKVAHGGYACELVRELSPPRQPEPALFALLLDLFATLERGPARAETLRVFELSVLDAVGLRPRLDGCVGCGNETLGHAGVLDVRRGGVVCGDCQGHGWPLSDEVRRALAAAQATAFAEVDGFRLSPSANAGCRELLTHFFFEHLGRPLKSLEFIAKLNHASP